ncbi:MAG: hypothetical protein AB8C02_14865 [Halioglobus sp.]
MRQYAAYLLTGIALLLLAACAKPLSEQQQARQFCAVLEDINRGGLDVTGLAELDGHARVLKALHFAAPDAIEKDVEQFHDVFSGWASAVSGEKSMLKTFEALSAPSLAGAQGRIGDYIAKHCGIRLGDGEYTVAERPSAQDICPGWPRIGSPNTFNNFPNLPDIAGANYFANDFMITRFGLSLGNAFAVEPGGKVVFHGQYPRARYFAFHPNDMDLNNLPSLRDKDLKPDVGSVNPFTSPVPNAEAASSAANYFTATLVFGPEPANPLPNTRYVGEKKHGGTNRLVINLLRLYASDLGNGANSGGVPLPSVTIYDADGDVSEHFDECDLYAQGGDAIRTELKFPALPIADHRAQKIPTWSTSSNFEAPSDTLANADVQYLSTVYSQRFGDVFVVRAKALTGPDTRKGVPVSAAGFDTRLYSLCNYNLWNGSAINCLLNTDLAVDEKGYFTIVISSAENRPKNLDAESATWMDWGPYLDGQMTFRHVYRENALVASITAALEGGRPSADAAPHVPVAANCNRETFELGGWQACFERSLMPRVGSGQ